jgi:hypothetical protein
MYVSCQFYEQKPEFKLPPTSTINSFPTPVTQLYTRDKALNSKYGCDFFNSNLPFEIHNSQPPVDKHAILIFLFLNKNCSFPPEAQICSLLHSVQRGCGPLPAP